jgi:formylglycine-generating enzyme required for sulfatase activity
MVVIPEGEFTMGSPPLETNREPDEGPRHTVRVDEFALARTEVTFNQWQACVDESGCRNHPLDGRPQASGNHPVVRVSWNDAQSYIVWLNTKVEGDDPYRLPSEAEWEYAARAGTQTPYPWDRGESRQYANFAGTRQQDEWDGTAPVGRFRENGFGLVDMPGNVWEWVQDCWHADYVGAPPDADAWLEEDFGDCNSRVARGGAWDSPDHLLRSANRHAFTPTLRSPRIGFRPAMTR